MKDDLASGIKNALERGYSMDQAVQSLINAGYSPNDVREAQQIFSRGSVSSTIYPQTTAPESVAMNSPSQRNALHSQSFSSRNRNSFSSKKTSPSFDQPQSFMPKKLSDHSGPQAPMAPDSLSITPKKKKSGTWVLVLIILLSSLVFIGALSYLIFVVLGS